MTTQDLKERKLKPIKNKIAFVWIPPQAKDIIVPETFYDLGPLPGEQDGLRVGRYYIGKTLEVGKKVSEIHPGDFILVHEYALKNYDGAWKKNEIYFIEEEKVKCKLSDLPENGYLDLREPISEEEVNQMRKGVKGKEEIKKPEEIPAPENI